jgi:hypothetical protein
MTPSRPLQERFWEKVRVGDPDECWPWLAGIEKNGYGRISLGRRCEGRIRAHRLAWTLSHGPITDGLYVLHRCDNPCCCNPAHLFLGTAAENSADMVRKNRQARGERVATAKLTYQKAREIRRLYAAGQHSQRELARRFGVHQGAIWQILHHKIWDEGYAESDARAEYEAEIRDEKRAEQQAWERERRALR